MKKKDSAITFLGKDTEFEGTLTFHGTIRIDGHFKGEISADGTLIVGEDALIEANMNISRIIVSGEVRGDIVAERRIDIRAPGKVFGDIRTPIVVIDEGVIFEGRSHASTPEMAEERKLVALGADEHTNSPPPSLGTISGVAADEETGKPIKDAVVKATCKGVGRTKTKTNASGHYELTNLKDGNWKVTIKAKGYQKGEATVEISGGGRYEQNFGYST